MDLTPKTELEKLQDWVEAEKKKGLIRTHIPSDNTSKTSNVESIAADINKLNTSKSVVEAKELF